jgi:hypothetical protein
VIIYQARVLTFATNKDIETIAVFGVENHVVLECDAVTSLKLGLAEWTRGIIGAHSSATNQLTLRPRAYKNGCLYEPHGNPKAQ